ncbi:MAG: prepilin peptidase [Micromonosporaceae bacterium]
MQGGAVVAMLSGLFGVALGIALVRPAYRLSVAADDPVRTACEGCAVPLRWLARPGCPGCGRRLGPPAWSLAAVSGVACAGMGWRFGMAWELVPYLGLALLGVLLGAIDLAVLRLPDVLVKPGFVVATGLLAAGALIDSAWWSLLWAGLAAAVLAGMYLILAILPGGALGYGDVKLAGLLGLYAGWLGWGEVLATAVLPFVLNGAVVIVLLILRRVSRTTLVPLGPAMLAGTWLAVVALPIAR